MQRPSKAEITAQMEHIAAEKRRLQARPLHTKVTTAIYNLWSDLFGGFGGGAATVAILVFMYLALSLFFGIAGK